MKAPITLLLCLLCLKVSNLRAQSQLQTVDVPTDPRSVAMGESFTGLPGNQAALMYNPAGIVGLTGVTASYNRRNLNWMNFGTPEVDLHYTGINLSVEVPFGVFAAHYNRLFLGEFVLTTAESPDGGEEVESYEHDIALGFGMTVAKGLSLGVAGKYFDHHDPFPGYSTTPAWLFDAGAIYSFAPFVSQDVGHDCLSLGVALQNVGTDLKVNAPAYSSGPASEVIDAAETLPEYFRFGVSYSFSFFPPEDGGPVPLRGTLTGELRNLLAPEGDSGRNSWGCGAELTFYDILTLRGGRVWLSYSSIYGEKDTPSPFRYGVGVSFPLERFGVPAPLFLSANYTAIPIRDIGIYWAGGQRMLLDTFSFELQYTGGLW